MEKRENIFIYTPISIFISEIHDVIRRLRNKRHVEHAATTHR